MPFCQLCFVFVCCVHSGVVEDSWEGIAGCIVHVAVHCMLWVELLTKGCIWLAVVHGYEVSSNRMLF